MNKKYEAGLISVVIPVYNRANQLANAVESVFSQEYRPIEVIIVDDGSTDHTRDMAEALHRGNPREISVIRSTDNRGPGAARELGRMRAKGEYLQYLDSDDLLAPRKFIRQVEEMQRSAAVEFVWGRARRHVLAPSGRETNRHDYHGLTSRPRNLLSSLLRGTVWATATPLYRMELLERVGPWKDLRQHEDWEYDFRTVLNARADKFLDGDECLCLVTEGSARTASGMWEIDDQCLVDRARAYHMIYLYSMNVFRQLEIEDLAFFERSLFFVGRLCHGRRLHQWGDKLVLDAHGLARRLRRSTMEYYCYRGVCKVLGRRRASQAGEWLRRIWRVESK